LRPHTYSFQCRMCFPELITCCDKPLPGFVSPRIRFFYFFNSVACGFSYSYVAGVFAWLQGRTQHTTECYFFWKTDNGKTACYFFGRPAKARINLEAFVVCCVMALCDCKTPTKRIKDTHSNNYSIVSKLGFSYSLCCWCLCLAAMPAHNTQQRRVIFFGRPTRAKIFYCFIW
jgi:hypothetical protein